MKAICCGLDPAGLYLAVLMKSSGVADEVVISGGAMGDDWPQNMAHPLRGELRLSDEKLTASIRAASQQFPGTRIRTKAADWRTTGPIFATLRPAALVDLLLARAQELGCQLVSSEAVTDAARTKADLVIIADGAQSPIRMGHEREFGVSVEPSCLRHALFDIDMACERAEWWFQRTPHGLVHACLTPSGAGSRLLMETTKDVIEKAGLVLADASAIAAFCADVFADELNGRKLQPTEGGWLAFEEVRNRNWTHGNMLLVGAAAYTSHHSVGLGFYTAMEDVEAFAAALGSGGEVMTALKGVEAGRRPKGAESLQRASRASLAWLEHVHRYHETPSAQFAFSFLTRSMRLTHEHLKSWAPALVEAVDALTAGPVRGRDGATPPPMFTPYRLGGLTLPNRMVLSPMCMYSAEDGAVNDFHLVHYGSRAIGGAGLIITEMTDVSREGRISQGCAGMYKAEHVPAWKRIVDFVKSNSDSKIGVQLAHAGRKGSISTSWEGHAQLPPDKAWETLAPSPLPFDKGRVPPRAMDRRDMDRVRDAFANAAVMADEAGFDLIELHLAHGYLLSSFISPLSNLRTDDHGGSLENRLRYPLEVLRAVRRNWPLEKPIVARISAHDLIEGGVTIEESIIFSRWLHEAGADMITVSTGAVTAERRPMAGRLYQTTWSDQIRNGTKIPTMAVGAIASFADANTIIAAGRADLCAMARGSLFDPYFPRHAAHQQGFKDLRWPNQYRGANALVMRDFD